jgi:hypothetical protein
MLLFTRRRCISSMQVASRMRSEFAEMQSNHLLLHAGSCQCTDHLSLSSANSCDQFRTMLKGDPHYGHFSASKQFDEVHTLIVCPWPPHLTIGIGRVSSFFYRRKYDARRVPNCRPAGDPGKRALGRSYASMQGPPCWSGTGQPPALLYCLAAHLEKLMSRIRMARMMKLSKLSQPPPPQSLHTSVILSRQKKCVSIPASWLRLSSRSF